MAEGGGRGGAGLSYPAPPDPEVARHKIHLTPRTGLTRAQKCASRIYFTPAWGSRFLLHRRKALLPLYLLTILAFGTFEIPVVCGLWRGCFGAVFDPASAPTNAPCSPTCRARGGLCHSQSPSVSPDDILLSVRMPTPGQHPRQERLCGHLLFGRTAIWTSNFTVNRARCLLVNAAVHTPHDRLRVSTAASVGGSVCWLVLTNRCCAPMSGLRDALRCRPSASKNRLLDPD